MKLYTPGWRRDNTRRKSFINERSRSLLKRGLPLLACGLLAGLILMPHLQQKTLPPLETKHLLEKNPKVANKLINPELSSIDRNGRPFIMRALHAVQLDPKRTSLDHPEGHFYMEDGTAVHFRANQGYFLPETKVLYLADTVTIVTEKGYRFTTQAAEVDFVSAQGHGEHPVEGEGPNHEHIQAEGFKLLPKSGKIHFLGKTNIVLSPQ